MLPYLRALLESGQLLLDLVHGVGVDEGAVVQLGHVGLGRMAVAVALLEGQLKQDRSVCRNGLSFRSEPLSSKARKLESSRLGHGELLP